MIEVTKNIEAIRQAKGLSQSELGHRLGVKQTTYSNWVNRSLDMPFGRLSAIADALGMDVIDVLTYPTKYVPYDPDFECEECKKKQATIDNLNTLIGVLTTKLNRL